MWHVLKGCSAVFTHKHQFTIDIGCVKTAVYFNFCVTLEQNNPCGVVGVTHFKSQLEKLGSFGVERHFWEASGYS